MNTKLMAIDSGLHARLKRIAKERGYTMLGLLNRIIREYLFTIERERGK